MSADDVKKIVKLLDEIQNNTKDTFVREVVNGNWVSIPLSELPTELAIVHVCKLIRTRLIQEVWNEVKG